MKHRRSICAFLIMGCALPCCAQSGFSPIRINVGGSAYTDASGQVWQADYGFLANGSGTASTTTTIQNTSQQAIYQTERANCTNSAPVAYLLPVPNGNYILNLKFAEIANPPRVMNIVVNGTTVATGFNIAALAGGSYIPLDRQFPVTVTSGVLSFSLNYVLNCPTLSGIEITAQTPQAGVIGLSSALATYVIKGPAFGTSGVAVINAAGSLDVAAGPPTGCLLQNGTVTTCITHFVSNESPGGVQNGANTVFTLANAPTHLMYFRNGIIQVPSLDYSLAGSTITAFFPPLSDDTLSADYTY